MPTELWLRDDAYNDAAAQARVRSDNPLPVKVPQTGPLDGLFMANMAPGNPIVADSANKANATATATLTGVPDKTTYITGFIATATGATSGLAVNVTVAGLVGGVTKNFAFAFPAGALVQAYPLIVEFPMPIPASAPGQSIVVTLPASGAGGTNASVNASGFQL